MLSIFRIGIKPVLVIISFLMAVFFSACANRSETELAIFKALDESLMNSNNTITRSNETIYASLHQKLTDPQTSYNAGIWEPKAKLIKDLSDSFIGYIQKLKDQLRKENDEELVTAFFIEKGKGKELHDKMKQYKRNILAIDNELDSIFHDKLMLTTISFDTSNNVEQDFTKTFFANTSTIAALSLLSKFQNNIKNLENEMILYCHGKCIFTGLICTFTSAIIAQSSSYVRAGENIEITAGVGYFSWRETKPEITINGKNVKLNETGVAVYKVRASNKEGKHFVTVRVNYIDQDWKEQTIERKVEYTVTKEINKKD